MNKFPNLLIRASAGTGKTFQLSNRYIALLAEGVPPDQILATTFTRKAAGEILDRIMSRLAESALDQQCCRELGEHIGQPEITRAKCVELLTQLTRQLHRLNICTLDSFFSQLASCFGLELGLPPGWRIGEGIQDNRLRDMSIESVLQGGTSGDISKLMNLLTKGEAERSIGELVRSTVRGLYDLFMETEEEAWSRISTPRPLPDRELAEVIDALFAINLADNSRLQTARSNDLAKAADGAWEEFIGKGIAAKVRAGAGEFYRKPIPGDVVDGYRQLLSHARSIFMGQLAGQTKATYQLLERFHQAYWQLKLETRSLQFADITHRLQQLTSATDFQRQPFRLDSRLSHVLLDEFQDTSLAQWLVLRPLVEHIAKADMQRTFLWAGGQPSLFCVGDVKQAIYGWRGGRAEIFDSLASHIEGLGHEDLTTSYRSAPAVIDTVNRVFSQMTSHPQLGKLEAPVQQWCQKFPEHTTARTALPGYAQLCTAPAADEDETPRQATLRYAADRIGELVEQAPAASIAALVRKNQTVAEMIYELRSQGVAASEEGGNPLTDSVAVQAILSLLTLADHPGDTVARFHLSRTPLASISGMTDYRDSVAAASVAREVRRALTTDGYGPTVLRWAQALRSSCNRRDRSRLDQLVSMAFAFQHMATLRTVEFRHFVQTERVADPTAARVRVMTIHQAKGLQFDVVVLPELDDQLVGQPGPCVVGRPNPIEPVDRVCMYRNMDIQSMLPDELQQMYVDATMQSVSESLSVLYVALTRAIHALYMILAPSKPNERNLHKTSAGLLRAALTDAAPLPDESTAFELGDPAWWKAVTTRAETAAPAGDEVESIGAIQLAPSPGTCVTGLEHAAPSRLEGGTLARVDQLLRVDNAQGMAYGNLMHAWMECVQWLDQSGAGRPSERTLRAIASKMDTTGLDVDKMCELFGALFGDDSLSRFWRQAAYESDRDEVLSAAVPSESRGAQLSACVHNERRFAVRQEGRMIAGTIDRLVLLSDRDAIVAAEVIDYKTDQTGADPDERTSLVKHYRPQIQAYRQAVSQMYRLPIERVSARLLLLSASQSRQSDRVISYQP